MKKAVFLALLLGIVPGALARAAEAGPDPQLVAKCQDCHGPAGSRSTPATPRLNGQDAGYLLHRLKGFLDPTSGQSCGSTYQVEVDHIVSRALGGSDDVNNLRCLCRAHNQLMAEVKLGSRVAHSWREERPDREPPVKAPSILASS